MRLLLLSALAACQASPPAPARSCCPVVELRQYTLRPGQRDVLIELFDRALVETQEAEGMAILGQFRDLDRPDRFVWLRGFHDMPGRARALGAFYGGPSWKAHSRAANATMIDAENVLLLRPLGPDAAFARDRRRRPPAGSTDAPARVVIATLFFFDRPPTGDDLAGLDRDVTSLWSAAGAQLLGRFVTEASENTFPALPVREGEHVYAVFAAFADAAAHAGHLDELARSAPWRDRVRAIAPRLVRPPETLRLAPTARSML